MSGTYAPISVECEAQGTGWVCHVAVGVGAAQTAHRVTLSQSDLRRLAPGHTEPEVLVHVSFLFLFEREPATDILERFSLAQIGHYFSDYPTVIAARLRL